MSAELPRAREMESWDEVVDQTIEVCGGDLRATIKALLVANGYLEAEVDRLAEAVSWGYVRVDLRRHD